jgi:hypothetical protein
MEHLSKFGFVVLELTKLVKNGYNRDSMNDAIDDAKSRMKPRVTSKGRLHFELSSDLIFMQNSNVKNEKVKSFQYVSEC